MKPSMKSMKLPRLGQPDNRVSQTAIDPTVINDAFDDADNTALNVHTIAPTNTVSTVWSHLRGTFKILSNRAVYNTLGTANLAIAVVETTKANAVITADVRYDSNTNRATAILGRVQDTENLWEFALYNNLIYIQERTAGTLTSRASAPASLVNGTIYPVTITINGSSLQFTVNSVTISYTSSQHSANTKHGLQMFAGGATGLGNMAFDNFKVVAL